MERGRIWGYAGRSIPEHQDAGRDTSFTLATKDLPFRLAERLGCLTASLSDLPGPKAWEGMVMIEQERVQTAVLKVSTPGF